MVTSCLLRCVNFFSKADARDGSKPKEKHRADSERTDRDRRPDQHVREKRHTDGGKEMKTEEQRDEKLRLVGEKSRDDDRTKDGGTLSRSHSERSSEVMDRSRLAERDVDGHQSSGDGTPGSHHSGEGHRRSNDKQSDDRGT